MKIFEYIITVENEGELQLIFPEIRLCMAKDIDMAKILTARSIPKEYENQIGNVKILVREFQSNLF